MDHKALFMGIGIFAVVLALVLIKPQFMAVSDYCKSLPNNAVNTVKLYEDSAGCPHWYIEIKSLVKNCFCIGSGRSCEGDPGYPDVLEGCKGALPPGCPTCNVYQYTPIADYGGLLEGFECAKDMKQSCPDGSTIIKKVCLNGTYVPTDNTCGTPCTDCNPVNPDYAKYIGGGLIGILLLFVIIFIVKDKFIKK